MTVLGPFGVTGAALRHPRLGLTADGSRQGAGKVLSLTGLVQRVEKLCTTHPGRFGRSWAGPEVLHL